MASEFLELNAMQTLHSTLATHIHSHIPACVILRAATRSHKPLSFWTTCPWCLISLRKPPRFPHSPSSTNILPPQSSSSPILPGTIVYHFNYSLAQYPQPSCPFVLNSTHSGKHKTHWVNPDVWFHQFYTQAAAICWRKSHDYVGCICTKSSLILNSMWFSLQTKNYFLVTNFESYCMHDFIVKLFYFKIYGKDFSLSLIHSLNRYTESTALGI